VEEKTVSRKVIYQGRILDLEVLEVELEDGRRALREVVRHCRAVAVVATLPDGELVFVRQYRKPVEREMLEVVAGLVEEDEDPADCARREVTEETGYEVGSLEHLGGLFPTPGYVSERIEIFHAELEGRRGRARPDADEAIEVVTMSAEEFRRLVREGAVEDGKTLAAWLLFEYHGGGIERRADGRHG